MCSSDLPQHRHSAAKLLPDAPHAQHLHSAAAGPSCQPLRRSSPAKAEPCGLPNLPGLPTRRRTDGAGRAAVLPPRRGSSGVQRFAPLYKAKPRAVDHRTTSASL